MIANKPSIYIYVNNPNNSILRDVYSGIEEEGVFYEIISREDSDLNKLVYDAANDSMLGSGIGISGDEVAFQIRGVKFGKNVQYYQCPSSEECRSLGTNSARAVKRQSFK